jgi:putative MFS transporter
MKNGLFNFNRREWLTIIIVAFGYFVDAYDLLVFSAVRKASLMAVGVPEASTMNVGLSLLNLQLIGLVIGGVLWGILSDKFGRRSILFVSILTYSLANLANAFVTSVDTYEILRIIAGIGLAGELGVGISLITENIPKEKRTYATTLVSAFGMLGAATGGFNALHFSWELCYIIGGIAGIALLILRISLKESVMFQRLPSKIKKGDIFKIFSTPRLLFTYFFCTLAGGITFVTIGLFIQNTPEFGKAFNLNPAPTGALAIIFFYLGAAPSEIFAGLISKRLKSRKKPMYLFYGITIASVLIYCLVKPTSIAGFYFHCTLLGLGLGYWTLLITTSSEQFGTNIRATAATSIPNIARAWSIPFTFLFTSFLKPSLGLVAGGLTVGIFALILSILSVMMLKETFEIDAEFTD